MGRQDLSFQTYNLFIRGDSRIAVSRRTRTFPCNRRDLCCRGTSRSARCIKTRDGSSAFRSTFSRNLRGPHHRFGFRRIALVKFGHVTALAPHLILGTLAGLYLPLALALVLNRIGFRYAFNLIPAHPIPAPVRDNATRLRAIALDSDQTDDEVH